MVTYHSKFIDNLSKVSEPLRILEKKGIAWHWYEEQQNAFEKIKNMLVSAPTLKFYDPTKEVEIENDASQSGLGSVLM